MSGGWGPGAGGPCPLRGGQVDAMGGKAATGVSSPEDSVVRGVTVEGGGLHRGGKMGLGWLISGGRTVLGGWPIVSCRAGAGPAG